MQSMNELKTFNKHLPKMADFFFGKSVFVTGASGFVGSVLVQTLLRCCPGIKSIYILLRSKKNVKPEMRKEKIFDKKIFEKLKEENKQLLDKVHTISGDISCSNLGISDKDEQLLIEEVSIVFHCAANVNLTKSLKFALLTNVFGLYSIIELSRKMKKFEVLVFTSTAYCNSNHSNLILEEEIYRLPFRAQKFLGELKNEDYKKLQELFDHCKPEWPNTYAFSKCVAENLILDTAPDLSVAIIRPSMIFSTWKHPMPGYEEGNSGHGLFVIGSKELHGNEFKREKERKKKKRNFFQMS